MGKGSTPKAVPQAPKARTWLRRHHDSLLLAALALLNTLAVWSTMGGLGFTWDEAVYRESSRATVDWLGLLSHGLPSAAQTDALWEHNWEFLTVPRLVHGLSWRLFHGSWLANLNEIPDLAALRFFNGAAHGLTCWLIGMFVLSLVGLGPAVAALLAYGTLPHVFAYGHFAMTETLMALMTLLVTFSFLRGIESGKWAIVTGVVFGLALNTKFNFLFLPIPLWLWAWWHRRDKMANNVMAMSFIGPVVWLATWPWVWHETMPRLLDYFDFFLNHNPIGLWWRGRLWNIGGNPPAPWFYALDVISVTTPLPTLLIGVPAVVFCAITRRHAGVARLIAFVGLTPLAISMAPGSPDYDSVRLFFPVYAMTAIMFGLGLGWARDFIMTSVPTAHPQRVRLALWAGMGTLLALPGIVAIAKYHPHETSYYNALVGGLEGAAINGYEIAYLGEAVNANVAHALNRILPQGAVIYPFGVRHGTVRLLQDLGILRADIVIEYPPMRQATYAIVHNRRSSLAEAGEVLWDAPPERRLAEFGWPDISGNPRVSLVRAVRLTERETP